MVAFDAPVCVNISQMTSAMRSSSRMTTHAIQIHETVDLGCGAYGDSAIENPYWGLGVSGVAVVSVVAVTLAVAVTVVGVPPPSTVGGRVCSELFHPHDAGGDDAEEG